ncbi:thiamine pyrophosphate-binding protein [Flavobacteriaceae bacterium]|nr:thiamine pyrophosphate-binding protein [Flavobacteriaceae bacterium]
MIVAEYISQFIEKKKIKNVFQLSGGMITQIIDKIGERKTIRIYSLLHEQSTAFAISAAGRISKKPSIAFATSGPGATNLLTGIGDCFFDSVPAIFITGQVNTFELNTDKRIRQLGFQETDIVSMAKPITKFSYQIKSANEIVENLESAYNISVSGRPGPVLIDIPMNIQRSHISNDVVKRKDSILQKVKVTDECRIDQIVDTLKKAEKPIIWAGNGIHCSNSENIFRTFVSKTKIPVVLSLHGIDLLESSDPNRIGFIGSYGNRHANKSISESDCLLFLGARADIRQTGANLSLFEDKKIIRIDCEEGELNNRISPQISLKSDINSFLKRILEKIKSSDFVFNQWHDQIQILKNQYPIEKEIPSQIPFINPIIFFNRLSKFNFDQKIYTVDVGSHQMWAAQALNFQKGDRFLTSGGMGSMGFALPASIGASIESNKSVIAIIGDGSFQMNIQELHSIFSLNLKIKIVVINNDSLGMIRQFQDTYLGSRYIGTKWGYTTPDFCKISQAYQIPSKKIFENREIDDSLAWLFSDDDAKLLEVKVSSDLNVYPKIAFGETMDKMEPDYNSKMIEST